MNIKQLEQAVRQFQRDVKGRNALLKKLKRAEFAAAYTGIPEKDYDKAVSIFQRKDSGKLFQKQTCEFFDAIAGREITQTEIKVVGWRYRPLDIVIKLETKLFVITCTTNPQERKDDTWPNEYNRAKRHAKEDGLDLIFVAFTVVRVKDGLRQKLPAGIRYMSATKDYDSVLQLAEEVIECAQLSPPTTATTQA